MTINMGMSGMNSPEQTLKELLARLLSVAPSPADSVLRLLAYARLYAAVSRLQAAGAAGRVCPDRRAHDLRAASLVRVLQERLSRSGLPLVDKARLAAAYHDLRSEAFPFRSSGSDEVFPEAVSSLMDRYSSAAEDGVLAEATVCRCLACYFYPDLWDDDEWACLLSGAVRRWASRLRPDGTWTGLTDVEALERVEVMNRYSYLFLDDRFDDAVRRACGHYAPLSAFHAPPDEGGGLRYMSLCQDLLLQGNACPRDVAWADRLAARFSGLSRLCAPQGDDAFYASSCLAVHLCESLLRLSVADGPSVSGAPFVSKQETAGARW